MQLRHSTPSPVCHMRSHYAHVQGFTSTAAMWQTPETPAAGINPLMQTPAPVSAGSVSSQQDAAAQPNRTAQAVLRKTKISPKKLNEFARLIRRMHIDDALVQCQVAPKKAAKLCYKVRPICCTLSCNCTRCLNAASGYLTKQGERSTQPAAITTMMLSGHW